jgi:hypothetical protein
MRSSATPGKLTTLAAQINGEHEAATRAPQSWVDRAW